MAEEIELPKIPELPLWQGDHVVAGDNYYYRIQHVAPVLGNPPAWVLSDELQKGAGAVLHMFREELRFVGQLMVEIEASYEASAAEIEVASLISADGDTYLAEWLIEGTDKLEALMDSFQSLDPSENYQLSGSQMICIAEALELFQKVIHDCSL